MSIPSAKDYVQPFDASASPRPGGHSTCPCINATSYLDELLEGGICTNNAVLSKILKRNVPCVSMDYGTGCYTHDLTSDSCKDRNKDDPDYDYCDQKWCYVNFTECYPSEFEMAATVMFSDLYYSYSTCGNPDLQYAKHASTDQIKNTILKDTIPGSKLPFHFKMYPNETIAGFNSEYHKEDPPYRGVMIDYVKKLQEIAEKDNMTFTFQPRSGGSVFRSKDSIYTAAVTDVQAGISDISTAMYWITAERLALTTFTVPLMVSPLFLFEIKHDSAWHSVFTPFDRRLRILLGVFVIIVGMLNVWFASRRGERSDWHETLRSKNHKSSSLARRSIVYCQLCLFSVIDSFVQCFGGGVEIDPESTFPSKIVAVGFGFFVLISISSYTANLTSFLTARNTQSYITSMEYAVSSSKKICAPNELRSMLKAKWKGAQFIFGNDKEGYDILAAVDKVTNGKRTCDALLVEKWVVESDKELLKAFCDKNLITTGVRALDLNVAFPVREEYSAGISHYMKKLEQSGTTFKTLLESYTQTQGYPKCQLQRNNSVEANPPMTVGHMAEPIYVLVICIMIAFCLKLFDKKKPSIFQAYDKSFPNKDDDSDCEDETFQSHPTDSKLLKRKLDTGKDIPESTTSQNTDDAFQADKFHSSLFNISKDVMKLSLDMKYKRGSGE